MKKILLMLLSLLTAFTFISCDGGNTDGGEEDGGNENETTVTYTITVIDGETPVAGESVYFTNVSSGEKEFATTDENGKATLTVEKGFKYVGNVADAEGMKNPKSFDKNNELVINVNKGGEKNEVTYIIYVKDSQGNPVEGVSVQICADTCRLPKITDSEGKATDSADPSKNWRAQITGQEGVYHDFDSDNTVTITYDGE